VRAAFAWIDGRIETTDKPGLPVVDRSFLLGDGIFETLRARRGHIIEWDAHVTRLRESAAAMSIELRLRGDELLAGARELLTAGGLDDAALRITISRGSAPARGLLPDGWRSIAPTTVIMAWPYDPPPVALLDRGVQLVVSSVRRDPDSPLAGVKSTSRADHVYARIEAEVAGADDALMLTFDGRLSETTTANIWVVHGQRIRTPSTRSAILAGTTRAWLLDAAPSLGVGVDAAEEADVRPADLATADEVFLSSSVAGIVPVSAVGGQPLGSGAPGLVTMALREARERWIDEQAPAP
jgi:branched-chain amino acid aminotransferase